MKIKFMLPIVAGALSVSLAVAPIAAVHAQTSNQPQTTETSEDITETFPVLEGVNLTEEQKVQLEEVGQETRAQMEDILSDEQRSQFRETFEQGGTFREAMESANITSDQKSQIRAAIQSSRSKIQKIITPEQRRQLIRNIRAQMSQGGMGGGFGGAGMF